MSEKLNPLVTDLSHWEYPCEFDKIKAAGFVGIIWKATQGASYTDPTYKDARKKARAAGLKWGSYHFGDNSDSDGQVANYLSFAQPAADELFCLDFEDNPGVTMGLEQARSWIINVESGLNREGQCVFYSGNTVKDALGSTVDAFFGERRLWLAQYGSSPTVQKSWKTYWLWQFTDGQAGPQPHTIDGVGNCDINSYLGSVEQLVAEWATGSGVAPVPPVPPPVAQTVTVTINSPPGVTVNVIQNPTPRL